MSTVSSGMGFCDEGDWPPGFRFHPTDEELVLYYLKFKICRRKLKLDIIRDTDVYKWEPEELPGQSKLKTGDRQWFFFSPRERRYPNATRLSRATRSGYWKATGKDRIIRCNSRNVGVKKTLVFYEGRAPNGDRTDWVMHEYTLDEDELKRCKNVKDYYALYKLYKKSGPGPKNGEQYGAPFREEDWADDLCQGFNVSDVQEPQVNITDEVTSVAHQKENGQALLSSDDIEEFMKQIANDPVLELPSVNDYCQFDSDLQVDEEEETVSTMINVYSRDCVAPEADKFHLSGRPSDLHGNFEFTQSGISQLQSFEGEVSSAPRYSGASNILQEEDFLEIDDLIDPEPTSMSNNHPLENVPPSQLDGLSELDLFHDADMFLRDLGPIIPETVLDPYLNADDITLVNNLNGHLQSGPYVENQMENLFWKNNETENAFGFPELRQQFDTEPTLGVGCESVSSAAAAAGTSENQRANEGGSSASWFSSNLWAFVESIPTTPASASENVNRAFERMSSFSRLRLNTLNTNVAVRNPGTGARRTGMNKGFFFFSILGVLCAILWVLIGNVRLWGRCIAS
ncbi:NAC domain-containing protein 17-like isoform X2 [Momordica charantia]|nr:NAC domain-containing protein 17-like isoform X2 [Momordica charantia]XP_022133714.1 NAC domain-containing protein 17-like isoform X2 [Momordica charantia]